MVNMKTLVVGAAIAAVAATGFATPASALTTSEGLVYSIDSRVSYSASNKHIDTLRDLSGFHQDGTLEGSGVRVLKNKSAISFTGNGGYSLSFDRHNFGAGITVEARVDLGKVDAWERVFDFATSAADGENYYGGADNILLARDGDSNNLRLDLYRGDYEFGSIYTTDEPLKGKTGFHTFTFKADESNLYLYVDGVESSTWDAYWDAPNYIEAPALARPSSFIGLSNWAVYGDAPLAGKVQYLRIYNYGLDEETIIDHATTNSKWDSLG
ncbi:MAG: hypothetical protein RLZ72_1307 [Actinomycetota bacterium]|jgi:hypothetical protein